MSGHSFLLDWGNGPWEQPDPGNAGKLPRDQVCMISLVTTGAETRTLADPVREGIVLQLNFLTDGGDCVVTADSAINAATNTIMTFADAGDYIMLVSRKFGTGYRWVVAANDGTALS